MITSANTIEALGEIAKAKPQFRHEILRAFLAVEHNDYYLKEKLSPECRNVALGHVLRTLPSLGEEILYSEEVREFIDRQKSNTRPSVCKLAQKFPG
jgi:hypothetical protein